MALGQVAGTRASNLLHLSPFYCELNRGLPVGEQTVEGKKAGPRHLEASSCLGTARY